MKYCGKPFLYFSILFLFFSLINLFPYNAENINLLKSGKINYALAQWWLKDPEPLETEINSVRIGIKFSIGSKNASARFSSNKAADEKGADNDYNDTYALQAALSSGAEFVTISNIGRPWITEPLFLESDTTVFFDNGVVIRAKKGKFRNKGDKLFSAVNRENISLYGHGAVLKMWRADYTYPPYEEGQWRHCLSFMSCRNITVKGLILEDSGGDGIYIGSAGKKGEYNYCRDILIEDVRMSGHYRQGISVISAENLLIKDCTIENTGNHSPSAGIDFEPNKPEERFVNCIVEDCIIKKNFGPGILFFLAKFDENTLPVSVTLRNNKIFSNRRPISIRNFSGGKKGTIILDNNLFLGFKGIDPPSPDFQIIIK